MESTRQNKIARLIQKELAEIFQKTARELFHGKMISVTTVRVTSDLSIARAYLSIFPSEKSDELLKEIRQLSPKIRFELGKKTGKQLRVIPNLEFFIDDSLDYIDHIDSLLKH
ncbi:MAG: 30S ribosome-binding factor RbfA [Prolixibacteraceae bacterium]|jgi:ribosome-binding factor A|nr:30S ribosome-binding factor RbfA [Prolixibacteraceae bacterium]